MEMTQSSFTYYRILHYGLLALQMTVLLANVTAGADLHLILAIVLFINNQVRFYLLKERKILHLLSVTAELSMLLLWPLEAPFALIFALTPIMLDLAFFDLKDNLRILLATVPTSYFAIRSYPSETFWLELASALVLTYTFFLLESLFTALAKAASAKLHAENEVQLLLQDSKLRQTELQNREELVILRERNRISRDIHDSVGHGFSTISIQLAAIEKIAPQNPDQAAAMAKTLGDFSRESLAKIRTALRELKPQTYSAYETVLLLDELCSKTQELSGMAIHFRYTGDVRTIGEEQSQTLYAMTQEFLANSSRHGHASTVLIHLHFREGELIYNLEDDGIGCEPDTPLGIGLRSMGERVRENQGSFLWQSAPGHGFRVKVVLPPLREESFHV